MHFVGGKFGSCGVAQPWNRGVGGIVTSGVETVFGVFLVIVGRGRSGWFADVLITEVAFSSVLVPEDAFIDASITRVLFIHVSIVDISIAKVVVDRALW